MARTTAAERAAAAEAADKSGVPATEGEAATAEAAVAASGADNPDAPTTIPADVHDELVTPLAGEADQYTTPAAATGNIEVAAANVAARGNREMNLTVVKQLRAIRDSVGQDVFDASVAEARTRDENEWGAAADARKAAGTGRGDAPRAVAPDNKRTVR